MKIQITFKDPDVVNDAFEEAKYKLVKQLMKELGISEAAAQVEADARLKKLDAIASKIFYYGDECVTIELDDETGTASVVSTT